MQVPKTKRIDDPELLKKISKMKCQIGRNCKGRVDPAHVTSKGAGGDDTEENVMPLCRKHHNQWHWLGIKTMVSKYSEIALWLLAKNRWDVMSKLKYKSQFNGRRR